MLHTAFAKATTFPLPLRLPAIAFVVAARFTALHLLAYATVWVGATALRLDASDLLLTLAVLVLVTGTFMAVAGAAFLLLLVARDLGAAALWSRLSATRLGKAAGHLAAGGAVNAGIAGTIAAFVGPDEPQFALLAAMGCFLLLVAALCAGLALLRQPS